MDDGGNTKDDLTLPKGTDDMEKLAVQLREDFDAGKEIVVTVLNVRACVGGGCQPGRQQASQACMHAGVPDHLPRIAAVRWQPPCLLLTDVCPPHPPIHRSPWARR